MHKVQKNGPKNLSLIAVEVNNSMFLLSLTATRCWYVLHKNVLFVVAIWMNFYFKLFMFRMTCRNSRASASTWKSISKLPSRKPNSLSREPRRKTRSRSSSNRTNKNCPKLNRTSPSTLLTFFKIIRKLILIKCFMLFLVIELISFIFYLLFLYSSEERKHCHATSS